MNPSQSLLLGRAFETAPPSTNHLATGRKTALTTPCGDGIIALEKIGHALTIAPSHAVTSSAVVIPNLREYDGQVVVIDPTGEAYRQTADRRREMGHTVRRLDPFGVIEKESDAINPLDLEKIGGLDMPTLCQMIAELVFPRTSLTDVWENSAFGLVTGVVGYVLAVPEKTTITGLVTTFTSDDVIYNLAVVLDTVGKRLHPGIFSEIATFLQQRTEDERNRILSMITSRNKAFVSSEVLKTCDSSSVSLTDMAEGQPLSIYLIIPPDKLRSHGALLRLWIGTLLHCVMARRSAPPRRTLFLLNECAQLGTFPLLETAIRMGQGYGLQMWTCWQDPSEVRCLYPASWPMMIRNSAAVQVFGANDFSASVEASALFGLDPEEIEDLGEDELVLSRHGERLRLKALDAPSET